MHLIRSQMPNSEKCYSLKLKLKLFAEETCLH